MGLLGVHGWLFGLFKGGFPLIVQETLLFIIHREIQEGGLKT